MVRPGFVKDQKGRCYLENFRKSDSRDQISENTFKLPIHLLSDGGAFLASQQWKN